MGETERGFGGEDADWVLEERERAIRSGHSESVSVETVIGMDGRDWMCFFFEGLIFWASEGRWTAVI